MHEMEYNPENAPTSRKREREKKKRLHQEFEEDDELPPTCKRKVPAAHLRRRKVPAAHLRRRRGAGSAAAGLLRTNSTRSIIAGRGSGTRMRNSVRGQ